MTEQLFGEHAAFVWIALAAFAIGIAAELWSLRQQARSVK